MFASKAVAVSDDVAAAGTAVPPSRPSAPPAAGHKLADLDAEGLARLRLTQIGCVFQDLQLIEGFNALENARLPADLAGVADAAFARSVRALFQRLDLGGLEFRFPFELSGGQAQRVAVARAVATEPALVLADEPTAALDGESTELVMHLLAELASKGSAVLVASHDPALQRWASRVLILRNGRLTDALPA